MKRLTPAPDVPICSGRAVLVAKGVRCGRVHDGVVEKVVPHAVRLVVDQLDGEREVVPAPPCMPTFSARVEDAGDIHLAGDILPADAAICAGQQ